MFTSGGFRTETSFNEGRWFVQDLFVFKRKSVTMVKPLTVLKSVGPKLVPFFKTVTIFFVLFGEDSKLESIFYCAIKCLPIISLIFFVLLHGMSFSEYYSYSRKILTGLVFSCFGDAFLVWKNSGYFPHGIVMFSIAQIMYIWAFGFRPFNPYAGAACTVMASSLYMFLLPGLHGVFVYLGVIYVTLIFMMAWRAIARVQFCNDLWTWTGLCGCIGAICFLTSDTIIAFDKFRAPIPYSHPLIMATYYAAQLGISLSVVDSQVDALLLQGHRTTNNDAVDAVLSAARLNAQKAQLDRAQEVARRNSREGSPTASASHGNGVVATS